MYIIFDNSNKEKITFFFCIKGVWGKKEFNNLSKKSLVFCLDKLLKLLKKTKKDLKGIGFLAHEVSFTSSRVSATFANTLSFALKIPVITVSTMDYNFILGKFKNYKKGTYVSAKYSGEPNIGKVKKQK